MTTTASDTPSTPSMDYRVVMRAPGEAEWTDVPARVLEELVPWTDGPLARPRWCRCPARVLEEPVPWTEENAIAYIRKATDVPEGTKYQVLRGDCEADEWETHRRYVLKGGRVKRVGLRLFVIACTMKVRAFTLKGAIKQAKKRGVATILGVKRPRRRMPTPPSELN